MVPAVILRRMSLPSQPSNPSTAVRQHPATSALHLGPYLAHGIQVEWYGERGQGPYRGGLEKLSAERPYVKGHKHTRDSFENLLPVLRPFSVVAVPFVHGGEPLAVEIARLLLGAHRNDAFTYRIESQSDGAVVHVTTPPRPHEDEPVRYCKVLLSEGDFMIQGPKGEMWELRNVLRAYDYLRAHHVAVGLSPGQFAVR